MESSQLLPILVNLSEISCQLSQWPCQCGLWMIRKIASLSQTLNIWSISIFNLGSLGGKCRKIYDTLSVWVWHCPQPTCFFSFWPLQLEQISPWGWTVDNLDVVVAWNIPKDGAVVTNWLEPWVFKILLMEKNPANQLRLVVCPCLSHDLEGFIRPRWCRISSTNSMIWIFPPPPSNSPPGFLHLE